MQTIQETLNRYNNADDARSEANMLVGQLKGLTSKILSANTEPITLHPLQGVAWTHEPKVTTPIDLINQPIGTMIRVDTVEYMRVFGSYGQWVNSLGYKVSSQELFCHMLECSGRCQLIAIGH